MYRYAPPVYLSEPDCSEPNVEQEPGPVIQAITEPFTAKVEVVSEPSVIVEPNTLDEPESEVAAELEPLREETPLGPQKQKSLLWRILQIFQ